MSRTLSARGARISAHPPPVLFWAAALCSSLSGCLSPTINSSSNTDATAQSPSSSPSPTASATPVPTVTVTATPTPTVTVTSTPSPTVAVAPTLSYASTSLLGTVGTPLSALFPTISGEAPSACSSTPALPPGLTLSSLCQITGTPTAITAATTYTITASNTGGASAANLTITITGPATKLAFVNAPVSLLVGKSLGPFKIAAQDAQGNTVPLASCLVSLALTSSGSPGTLASGTGALWDLCRDGTVTFSDIYLQDWTGPGGPVTLTASATGLASAVTSNLNVLVVEQKAYLKAPNAGNFAYYGGALAFSSDGNTLAVGAYGEKSNQITITNGPTASADVSLSNAGAVYILTRTGQNWAEQAYLKAPNAASGAFYGSSVALSSNGNTLAVGASGEASNQTTITNGPTASSNTSAALAGAVYIVTRSGTNWTEQAYLKAPNAAAGARYGGSVALSSDGNTLAVGAWKEASNQSTITNGPTASSDVSMAEAGAVYILTRSGASWTEQAYLKAPNPASARYGSSISLSSDGNTLAVGAYLEPSNQTTITNGTTASSDTSSANAGAVYVVTRSGTSWSEQAYLKAPNANRNSYYGGSVSLSSDGNTVAIGASGEASNQSTITNGPTASSNTSIDTAGAVYILTRVGQNWSQQAYLKAPNPSLYASYGDAVSLSANGNVLAVCADQESSSQTTFTNGPSASTVWDSNSSGAVYILTRTGQTWSQRAYLKPPNPGSYITYGLPVALSSDGGTLALGVVGDKSNQSTLTNGAGVSYNTSLTSAGAVHVLSIPWNTSTGF